MTEETYNFTTTQAVLSDSLDGDPPYHVHGRAIGVGDVTVGASRVPKYWPEETLSAAASTLSERPLVRDHNNTVDGVVGEVIEARFGNGAVLYRAELDDAELAEKVANGRLEVSARIFHDPIEELEEHPEADALVVTGAVFDNLSLVPRGAAPSNSVELGDSDQMSAAELREAFMHEVDTDAESNSESVGDDDDVEDVSDGESAEEDLEDADDGTDVTDDEELEDVDDDVDDEELEDTGYVALPDQTSNGWSVTVDQAHYEDSAYFIGIHTRGDRYGEVDPPLGESLGDGGPFGADEVVEDVEITLDEPLTEDDRVYATLHYANNQTKSNHITRAGNVILNSAEVTVQPEIEPTGPRLRSRSDQFSDEPDENTVDDSDASPDAVSQRTWMRTTSLCDNPTMKLIEIDPEALPEDVDEFESPTVVEAADLEELNEQAKDSDEIVEEMREDLASLGDYREQVEDLESEIESLEAQTEEIDEVKGIYAEALAASSPFDEEELMEFPISTLREKCEDIEHEALNPAPRSQDVDEDELGEENEEDAELEAQKEELSEKIEWYETRGWNAAAENLRSDLEALSE